MTEDPSSKERVGLLLLDDVRQDKQGRVGSKGNQTRCWVCIAGTIGDFSVQFWNFGWSCCQISCQGLKIGTVAKSQVHVLHVACKGLCVACCLRFMRLP